MPDLTDSDLSQIFAIHHIFRIVNYKEFNGFLTKNNIKETKDLFEGYRFFIKTISRGLLETLSRSPSLHLESSLTFDRAMHRGIPLDKIGNCCQKVIFLKNLYEHLQLTWKSPDSNTLENNLMKTQNIVLTSLDAVLTNNVTLAEEYVKFGTEKVIRRLAINYVLVFLNDTRHHGRPLGYFFSLSSERSIGQQYAQKVFNGYKLALCFLWQKLLNEENVESSKLIGELADAQNWADLDETFETARDVEAKIEKEFAVNFGFEKYFKVVEPIDASIWDKSLFDKVPAPMLSKEEILQQELLWYPVQAMSGMIFNGVSAFARLLVGDVKLKSSLDNPDKTIIVRFVHPLGYPTTENQHDYSYAIMVDSFGTIADYSGWLVFYDCCGDYSGFSGSEYQFAEMIIKQLTPHLEVKNVVMDKKELLEYLELFSGNFNDEYETTNMKIPVNGMVKKQKEMLKGLSTRAIISHQHSLIQTYKGYLLELLAYYYLAEKPFIQWRYRNQKLIGDDEIDVVTNDDTKTLLLISCMTNYEGKKVQKLDDQSKLMEAKRDLFAKQFGEYETVRKIIFLPEDPTTAQIEEAQKFQVSVHSLKRLLNEDNRFSSLKKTDILRLFTTDKNENTENNPFPLLGSFRKSKSKANDIASEST